MVHVHFDEETRIKTFYTVDIEGVEVDFKDSCCPGATISLYGWSWLSGEREQLYTMIECPNILHWTPPASQSLVSK
ncbi:hypothetical protein BDN71DRAFT_234574 [Pleurotus eryngii]|uniref:Uncharacterized protein n=1 Tax=Pleurotus eryngii TaxID=5323 RepID=A0A9P5ZLP5_PLEER|nr:hypothetical protein BDN71DRAFT_234574 [Pleurotus eryngii]